MLSNYIGGRWWVGAVLVALVVVGCGRKPESQPLPVDLPVSNATIELTSYGDWDQAYRLSNGTVEVIVVPQIARIMYYGPVGGQNLLWNNPSDRPMMTNPVYYNHGGDKAWLWPQDRWKDLGGRGMWPPPQVLDSLPYRAHVDGDRLVMWSAPIEPLDARLVREIWLPADDARVHIETRLEALDETDPLAPPPFRQPLVNVAVVEQAVEPVEVIEPVLVPVTLPATAPTTGSATAPTTAPATAPAARVAPVEAEPLLLPVTPIAPASPTTRPPAPTPAPATRPTSTRPSSTRPLNLLVEPATRPSGEGAGEVDWLTAREAELRRRVPATRPLAPTARPVDRLIESRATQAPRPTTEPLDAVQPFAVWTIAQVPVTSVVYALYDPIPVPVSVKPMSKNLNWQYEPAPGVNVMKIRPTPRGGKMGIDATALAVQSGDTLFVQRLVGASQGQRLPAETAHVYRHPTAKSGNERESYIELEFTSPLAKVAPGEPVVLLVEWDLVPLNAGKSPLSPEQAISRP